MCVLHVFKVDLTTIIKKPLNPKLVVKAKQKKFCTNLFLKRNRIVFGQVYSFALISRLKKETVSVRRLTWRLKPESINSSLQYQIDQNQDFLLAPNFKKNPHHNPLTVLEGRGAKDQRSVWLAHRTKSYG